MCCCRRRPAMPGRADPSEPTARRGQQRRWQPHPRKLRELLRQGKLDSREVELKSANRRAAAGRSHRRTKHRTDGLRSVSAARPVRRWSQKEAQSQNPEARELLTSEEAQKLIDMDKVRREVVHRAEQAGIIFIDEIDKIAGRERASGPMCRAKASSATLLPIVEGSTVTTKVWAGQDRPHLVYCRRSVPRQQTVGPDSGTARSLSDSRRASAAHAGRFGTDFERAGKLAVSSVSSAFGHRRGQAKLAQRRDHRSCPDCHRRQPHARRHWGTATSNDFERVLDELSFEAPEVGRHGDWAVEVTAEYVRQRVESVLSNPDLSKYIL